MKLHEITEMASIFDERVLLNTRWESPMQLQKWLKQNGFKKISRGAFSSVYAKPNHNRVVKLSYRQDDGWTAFVNWVLQQTKNKYLPNIPWFKQYQYRGNEFFVTIVERLKPFDIYRNADKINDPVVIAGLIMYADLSIGEEDSLNWALFNKYRIRSAKRLVKKNKSHKFIWTLNRINKLKGGEYYYDLHSDNFMVRPSTGDIVITDPLS